MQVEKKASFWRIFFASLLALVVASILFWVIIFAVIGSSIKSKPFQVGEKAVLHITLDESIRETTVSRFNSNTLEFEKWIGLNDILMALEIAAKDDNVSGLFIDIDGAPMGFSTLHEFRSGLEKFKASGKFIVAYNSGEMISQKALLLSSVANESYVFPTSVLEFLGLGTELMYFKNMLDKLSIEMQVIRGENNDFKSAVEPYFLDKMSDSSRLQLDRILEVLWSEYKATLGKSRNIGVNKLDSIAENALVRRGSMATKFKFYDGEKYRDEVISLLKEKSGTAEDKELNLVDFAKYVRNKSNDKKILDDAKKPNVAVLFAEGEISKEGNGIASETLVKDIRKIRENKDIKALVLRVNSPGGSALASDEIWRELSLLAQSKTLVVSMGDVAASGGYYIAAPAHCIFAQRSTITGSIGVFGVLPYTGKLFREKLGIDFDYAQTNRHATMSLNKKLTPEQFGFVQDEVNAIYDDFLALVAQGRKLNIDQVKKIAKGRVWMGEDALKIGLVDKLGGLQDAMRYAAEQVELKDPVYTYYPKPEEDKIGELVMSLAGDEMKSTFGKSQIGKEAQKFLSIIKTTSSIAGVQARLPFFIEIE